jgi:hypothetical protein
LPNSWLVPILVGDLGFRKQAMVSLRIFFISNQSKFV